VYVEKYEALPPFDRQYHIVAFHILLSLILTHFLQLRNAGNFEEHRIQNLQTTVGDFDYFCSLLHLQCDTVDSVLSNCSYFCEIL